MKNIERGLTLRCPVCNASAFNKTATFKHYWYLCQHCKNAFRAIREKPLIKRLPAALLKLQPKLKNLLISPSITSDSSIMFDYMANENHTQSHIDGGVFEKFMEQIVKRQNISLKGKSILDISGGNGSFAKNLESQGARVVLTEYSQASVNYAREHYGVKAECFDFQSDSIQEIFHEKFDLVLLRAAVMFCEDIPRFANDLKKILHPDSQVVLEGVEPPTPAAFLRWQFDDYTYLRMYQVKSVVEFFEKSGYELLDQYEGSSRHYLDNYSKAMKLAQLIYALPVCLKNLKWNLYTHNFNLLFKPDFLP